jgi:cytoskeleton protein RodZ
MEHLPEDRDDGGLPPFQEGVGEILRRRRESYGQDLPTVASQLHIRLTYLRAVETGRFKDLPGMAYASGFVRSYGDYLGLDGEELVRLFREEVAGVDRQVRLNVPIVASEGRIPGGAVLLLSGFLAVLAYGVWYYLADRNKSLLDLVPEVPSQLRAILGKEVPVNVATAPPMVKPQSATAPAQGGTATAPAQGNAAPASAPDPAVPSGVAGAQEAPRGLAQRPVLRRRPSPPSGSTFTVRLPFAAGVAEDTAEVSAGPAAEPDAGEPAPRLDGLRVLVVDDEPDARDIMAAALEASGARVKLVARMDSWVQINDKTGKTYYSAVLRAGQAIEVPNQPGLLLTAGNAGGLDVLVDGAQMPSLGAVGLVKRDLPLDPAGLKTTNGH